MSHKRLFIPGPSEVRPEILMALATPQIGHRSGDYSKLHENCVHKLQKMFGVDETSKDNVLIFTCSSTGVMEGAVRNTCAKRCANFVNGAFSKRWHVITKSNGIPNDKYEVEMGKAITPKFVDDCLAKADYDAMTVVWNETSTGVQSPIPEIAKLMKEKYPNVMFLVDAVSNMAGVKIEPEKINVDVILAGVQKCFAMPAGLAVAYISPKAYAKAKTIEFRGCYTDFIDMAKKQIEKFQTPSTPSIPHMFALNAQMDYINAEGDNRYKRHHDLAERVRGYAIKKWGADSLFAEKGYESETLTCIKNTRGVSIDKLNKELGKEYMQISNGYGDLKEKTFRIAHMGDTQMYEIDGLLKAIERIIETKGKDLMP